MANKNPGPLEKLYSLVAQVRLPGTRLPFVFMKKNDEGHEVEPLPFVGEDQRRDGVKGFEDDRVRNDDDYVTYAPRKIVPDLIGGGILV